MDNSTRRIGPGIYATQGGQQMEFDIPELLHHLGLPDTEENRDAATAAALKIAAEQYPNASRAVSRLCPECRGRGRDRTLRRLCGMCGGKGQVITESEAT